MSTTRVLLTAGFARANHVLALAEMLRRDGVDIAGILIVSPFTKARLRSLVRQRGGAAVSAAIPRLLGRTNGTGTVAQGRDALARLMDEEGIEKQSLTKWAARHGVPCRTHQSLNAPGAIEYVADARPDWVVYGGGGILGGSFIDAAGGRVLNAHSGPLPEIRGMNACEWSLLLGYAPTVTIHVIDRGIDTGGVISSHPVPVEEGDTVDSLRSRCVRIGVLALREVVLNPPSGLPKRITDAERHRQCFVLAPALHELLERRMRSGLYLR